MHPSDGGAIQKCAETSHTAKIGLKRGGMLRIQDDPFLSHQARLYILNRTWPSHHLPRGSEQCTTISRIGLENRVTLLEPGRRSAENLMSRIAIVPDLPYQVS